MDWHRSGGDGHHHAPRLSVAEESMDRLRAAGPDDLNVTGGFWVLTNQRCSSLDQAEGIFHPAFRNFQSNARDFSCLLSRAACRRGRLSLENICAGGVCHWPPCVTGGG